MKRREHKAVQSAEVDGEKHVSFISTFHIYTTVAVLRGERDPYEPRCTQVYNSFM
jgi:hypothetical protein